jgi:hypothetical protein
MKRKKKSVEKKGKERTDFGGRKDKKQECGGKSKRKDEEM